jgi:hypothetical protein
MVQLNEVIGCCNAEKKDYLTLSLKKKANFSVVSHSVQITLSSFRSFKYPVLQENDHHSKSDNRFHQLVNIFFLILIKSSLLELFLCISDGGVKHPSCQRTLQNFPS